MGGVEVEEDDGHVGKEHQNLNYNHTYPRIILYLDRAKVAEGDHVVQTCLEEDVVDGLLCSPYLTSMRFHIIIQYHPPQMQILDENELNAAEMLEKSTYHEENEPFLEEWDNVVFSIFCLQCYV